MGKKRRMDRIFGPDGHALMVAMDHGTHSAPAGLEDMGRILSLVREGGADAVLLNPGAARHCGGALRGLGLVLRMDLPPTLMVRDAHESRRVFGVEQALELGADAVIVNGGTGSGVEETTLDAVADTVNECAPWNMPVIGEMIPGGFDADPGLRTPENLAANARIASEIGVDVLKMPYCEGFGHVVRHAFVPVLVLGGARTDDDVEFVLSIRQAMEAGASGVAIGRNIWGHRDPLRMTRALAAVVHGRADRERIEEILAGQAG